MNVSLQNLAKINKLEPHDTNREQVAQLLKSVSRALADAAVENISLETRFDVAYKAVMQLCMAALWSNGYRPSRSSPGHHQTMIQSLVHSMSVDNDEMRLLDTFRVKRNVIDYTGDLVDEGSVRECLEAARRLRRHFDAWLLEHRPDLC